MKLVGAELVTLRMPLVSPFTTSFGTITERFPLLVTVTCESGGRTVEGWGECATLDDPWYSPEYADSAKEILARYLLPAMVARQEAGREVTAETFAEATDRVIGHRMPKAALELALLDAQLRLQERSLASYLGVDRDTVPSGVSVGIQPSIACLLEVVGAYLDAGYVRIKLKIKPGWDVEPVAAVRETYGDIPLQVDANAAYTLADAHLLARLDAFDLVLVEQPLAEDDIHQHALLARRIRTPLCLDESVVSASSAAAAITTGAAAVLNIKPGRVGGYLEARRIHDLARAHGVGVWCGGMAESGIGRAANIALAGLPGFTLPGDVSASDRFFAADITEPVTLENGYVRVPTGPGIGVDPIPEAVEAMAIERRRLLG
jgi:o-succinylbenzoate synthase